MKGHCHQRKDRAAMSRKSAPPPGGPLPLVLAALFSGLTAVLSWINIPLFFTPVPVNLALIGPYLAGLLLGVRYGCLSQLLYILLGCVGLPVFAGFSAGAGVLAGPTGGFIAGYVLCAAICGLSGRRAYASAGRSAYASGSASAGRRVVRTSAARRVVLMSGGLLACYGCGLAWFMISSGSTLGAGLVACVLPFLPGDAVKIAAAALLAARLNNKLPPSP